MRLLIHNKNNYSRLKILVLLLFIFASFYCKSQGDSAKTKKYELRLNAGVFVSYYSDGFRYFPNLGVATRKIFLGCGPVFGPKLVLNSKYFFGDHFTEGYNAFNLNGVAAICQYNPNKPGRIFDFYFQNWFSFVSEKDKNQDLTLFPGNLSYSSYQKIIENYIGYGFNVKFLKHFYVSQSFGIGAANRSFSYDILNDNKEAAKEKYTRASFLLTLSMGYRYKLNRKG